MAAMTAVPSVPTTTAATTAKGKAIAVGRFRREPDRGLAAVVVGLVNMDMANSLG
jgi:hypothetical protein